MSVIGITMTYSVGGGAAAPTPARLVTAFERAGAELADVGKHVLPRVVTALEGATKRQFAAQGAGPLSGSWAALSTAYAAWKSKRFPGAPKLVATGQMQAALTEPNAAGARRDINGNALAYGTQGVPYAGFHQSGTGKMPARPPFDFGSDAEQEISAAVAAGVRAAIREGSDGVLDPAGGAP